MTVGKTARLGVVLISVVCVLTGCGSRETTPAGNIVGTSVVLAPVPDEPAYGDTLVRGLMAEPTVLLPVLASDSGSYAITTLVYNGLITYDKNLQLAGDLAERWEISPDYLKIRFFLRKNVKWHDGQPFSSKDVEFTYRIHVDPKTPTPHAGDFLRVKEFRVLDEHTVEVTYDKPYAPALISWSQPMLPGHLLEGRDVSASPLKTSPVGTGPYAFEEWVPGDRVVLRSFHDYFQGRPYIERIVNRIIPDRGTMFLELQAQGLDFMTLTPLQYARQTDSPWFRQHFAKHKYLTFGYTFLGYNLKHWKFQDKRVRQALTSAINRQGIIDGALQGLGLVAHGPYKPDTQWYNPNVRKYPYDPARAKQLLADAGWTETDTDGTLLKDGKRFEFIIVAAQANDQRKSAAIMIQRDLKEIGVNVTVRAYEWTSLIKNFINKRNFEACLLGWGSDIDPNQIDIWSSDKINEHELNIFSYENSEVDELLKLGASTYNSVERKQYYGRFQEILAEDQPCTFLWFDYALPIINSRFRGIAPSPAGIGHDIIRWYVPKALQKHQTIH